MLLLVLVHLLADVGEDIGAVSCELEVLLLVIIGFLKGSTQLGVFLLKILAILYNSISSGSASRKMPPTIQLGCDHSDQLIIGEIQVLSLQSNLSSLFNNTGHGLLVVT